MADITREHLDKYVHSRLRRRVRMYLGISAAILVVILYRVIFVAHGADILYPLVALALGLGIGILMSRMFNVQWDKDAEQVISRMDVYGTALLVAYIIFEVSGEHFIKEWFQGPDVLTIILALAGGAVLGRGIGMARTMFRVLRENTG